MRGVDGSRQTIDPSAIFGTVTHGKDRGHRQADAQQVRQESDRLEGEVRKCRTVELKIENELFLQFLCNYDTPEREHYRAIYEAADMAQREKEAKDSVRADGRHSLRDVSGNVCPLVRAST